MSRVDYCNAGLLDHHDTLPTSCSVYTERCSASRYWHTPVRPRLVTLAAWGIAMARRPRTYPLQTGSHSASLFAVQGSWVPGRLLYTRLRHSRRHLQSATVHHLTVPRYWLSTCDRWAFWSGTRYQSPRPGAYQQQQPQTIAEDDPTRLVFSDCLRLLQSTCTRYFNATTQHRQRSKDASRVCAKTIIDIDIGNGTIH